MTKYVLAVSLISTLFGFDGAFADEPSLKQFAHCQICWIREGSGEEPVVDTTLYDGEIYYFCSGACKTEFLAEPGIWSIDPVASADTGMSATSFPS